MRRMLWLGPVVAVALVVLLSAEVRTEDRTRERSPATGSVEVLGTMSCNEPIPTGLKTARIFNLCDGETKVLIRVAGVATEGPLPRETASEVAKALWDQWQIMKEEEAMWARRGQIVVAHGKGHTSREPRIWESELKKMVDTGYNLFHNPELGANGISCDMCHPDASNTHPETYPKFQTQLKEVALLRDMINWCIENPMEAKPLPDGDPRMKAIEAYILSARKEFPLDVGKH